MNWFYLNIKTTGWAINTLLMCNLLKCENEEWFSRNASLHYSRLTISNVVFENEIDKTEITFLWMDTEELETCLL